MIVYYSEYSMFVVGDHVPKTKRLPKWASQLKTIMSDLSHSEVAKWELPISKPERLRVGSVHHHWQSVSPLVALVTAFIHNFDIYI